MPLKNWYRSTYNALLIVSVMLFLIAFGTTGDVNIGTTISAYSLLVLSIFMILVLVVNTTLLAETNDISGFQSIMDVLRSAGPLFLILGVIGFVLYLLIYYKNDILENRVSNSYYTFSNITTLIVLTQIYLLYTNMNNMNNMKTTDDGFNTPFKLSKVVSGCLLIIGLFSLMSSMILYTILRYYTTDGFTVQK
jgi:hypothetical protein